VCQRRDPRIRYSGAIGGDANQLLKEVQRRGLEGIIGKLRNSVYEPGRRSGAWIKLKCVNEQEFVIGGYTPPQGARKYFGAILVGYYKDRDLVFAGKVGTGFTTKSLATLHKKFRAEERADCPFVDLPSKQNGQWVLGITPSMMKKYTGSTRSSSPKSNSPSGRGTENCVHRFSWGCAKIKSRAKLFAKRQLLHSGARCCQTRRIEAEGQSVRAFSLAYSNIKSRKIDRED
jgi:ATP-dependent DNA ligase